VEGFFYKMKTEWNKLKRVVISDAVVFDWVLLIGFAVLALVAVNYNARARSIPMALGILGTVLVFFQLIVDMFPSLRRKLGFVVESGLLADQKKVSSSEADNGNSAGGYGENHGKGRSEAIQEWVKILRLILWIAAFIVLLGVTHYLIAVGLFVVLVTRIEAGESWVRSIVLATSVNAGFFILFDLILNAQL
jgi:hypothetical protein